MAPMKTLNSNYSSSNYGENIARQANVLASCYVVDAAASLKGFHYCTTLAAGKNTNPFSPFPIHAYPRNLQYDLSLNLRVSAGAEWYS